MLKWTYSILNIIFFAPVLILAFACCKKIIIKNQRFIFYSGLFGFFIFFIIDPIATSWGAWGFDYSKTLGIYFGNSVFEELIFAILVSVIVAIAVAVVAEREEKHKPFISTHVFKEY